MATVYLARDLKHDRAVALKVFESEVAAAGAERFQREIRLVAQLQHPQIVPVYDSGGGAGLLWFTMPYIEGRTLRERLRREGPLPVADAVGILEAVARALAYAHRRGVIHRDLKPENVLLSQDNVFLADFGVAKTVHPAPDPQLTGVGVVPGTPAYVAPEQAAGDPITDHRVDIYAFGVLAYELLAGEPPFTNLPVQQLLAAHILRDPEPLASRRPDVPAPLAELVMRCLRKDPVERWESADDLSRALSISATSSSTLPAAAPPRGPAAEAVREIERGRAAFAEGKWREAYERLTAADAEGALEPSDLELLAEAAWWLADGATCVRLRERAYREYRRRGDDRGAAGVALALAEDHFHRVARSVGQGWLRRAERHLEGLADVPERGWLYRLRGMIALEMERKPEEAIVWTERTLELASRLNDADLEALALQDRGRILVALGRLGEGLAFIDEAMAAATAGELTPHTTGRAYCNLMSVCESLGDFARAAEWHDAARRWCEPYAESGFPGICRVHRAGLLRRRGNLPEAEREARRAAEELSEFLTDVAGEAFYELGEIRLQLGDLDRAREMFAEAHARGRSPQPGLAVLRLREGKGDAARTMIERALAQPGLSPPDRARLLPALVEITAEVGALEPASAGAAELEAIAATYGSPALAGAAAHARGAVELARGRAEQATYHLERARRIWAEIELPFELVRTRQLLARAYTLLEDAEHAELERRAASAILGRIAPDLIPGSSSAAVP